MFEFVGERARRIFLRIAIIVSFYMLFVRATQCKSVGSGKRGWSVLRSSQALMPLMWMHLCLLRALACFRNVRLPEPLRRATPILVRSKFILNASKTMAPAKSNKNVVYMGPLNKMLYY